MSDKGVDRPDYALRFRLLAAYADLKALQFLLLSMIAARIANVPGRAYLVPRRGSVKCPNGSTVNTPWSISTWTFTQPDRTPPSLSEFHVPDRLLRESIRIPARSRSSSTSSAQESKLARICHGGAARLTRRGGFPVTNINDMSDDQAYRIIRRYIFVRRLEATSQKTTSESRSCSNASYELRSTTPEKLFGETHSRLPEKPATRTAWERPYTNLPFVPRESVRFTDAPFRSAR